MSTSSLWNQKSYWLTHWLTDSVTRSPIELSWTAKNIPKRAKNAAFASNKVEMAQIGLKMDQKGLNKVFDQILGVPSRFPCCVLTGICHRTQVIRVSWVGQSTKGYPPCTEKSARKAPLIQIQRSGWISSSIWSDWCCVSFQVAVVCFLESLFAAIIALAIRQSAAHVTARHLNGSVLKQDYPRRMQIRCSNNHL